MPVPAADRMRAYRARMKTVGHAVKGGKSGHSKSKWENAQFIALDGEGESAGEMQRFEVGTEGKIYHAKEHLYTLLAASTGESLYNGGKRLSTHACIDFLLDLSDTYSKGVFVIFAGGYDINHMLMWGFEKEQLQKISRGERVEFKFDDVVYDIQYRSRKSLSLRRGLTFVQDAKGQIKQKWESSITVWDVWGFFQDSFVVVIQKWLTKEWRHYELIKDMKLRRGDFANVEQSKINAYNAAELESLVAIMEKVRDAVAGLDLKLNRWDGAGSIAAAIMRKHNIREFKKPPPDELDTAIRCAYAGGRIEICKIGTHHGKVYDYDINSAYPSVNVGLPCMLHGNWLHGVGEPPPGFTLVHCSYDFADGLSFYPLFYRTDKMQISFPRCGEGWYWLPEFIAARDTPGILEIIEWWHWQPACNHKPFHWIEDYYATRQKWTKSITEEWQKGGEKIIKLGLNSLYGKTAQQLGGTADKAPTYHQMEWAGYITSATRARLYTAAMLDSDSVIGFATDGIFTTRPLPVECSTTKAMGAWELKEPVPVGMTIAMAGVYWWHHADGGYGHFSRGFDKDSMKTPDTILNAWKSGLAAIDIPMHRLIGMGSACTSKTLWEMRGRFTEGFRTLRLDGKSNKRAACNVKKTKPHLKLVDLMPTENLEYGYGAQACSHPYPVIWLEDETTEDFANEKELIKELFDIQNI